MLQFNRKQLSAIGNESLRTRLGEYLRQHLPQLQSLPAGELDRELDPLLADARRHGLTSQRAAATFVVANVVLGRDVVARDPAFRQILADRSRPVADRARLLHIWLARSCGALQRTTRP